MFLGAAVYTVYQSSNKEENRHKDWKGRISSGIEDLQRSPPVQHALRCYNGGDTTASADNNYFFGTEMTTIGGAQQQGQLQETSFRDDMRIEWINAVLGPNFNEENASIPRTQDGYSRKGVGLSGIESYVAYNVTIPPCKNVEGDKLGITLSRLALGLYVRTVYPGSEAWCAGIQPNSVLVDINGMSLLAEPSRQAFERIWQYEGYFDDPNETLANRTNQMGSSTVTGTELGARIQDIVRMTLIKDGKMYSVVLLSAPPYGIDWAPCGNFALVKKAYAFGADAGVKRGSIITALNGKNIHELDHTVCAMALREAFESKSKIELGLCFTPSAARPSHHERKVDGELRPKENSRPQVAAEYDGVEVRVHSMFGKNPHEHSGHDSVAQLATRAAAGELYSVSRKAITEMRQHRERVFRPCPLLTNLLETWSSEDAIMYLLQYQKSEYDEQKLLISQARLSDFFFENFQSSLSDIVDTFLLQLISFAMADSSREIMSAMVEVAKTDDALARRMEMVAASFQFEILQDSLRASRYVAERRLSEKGDKRNATIDMRMENSNSGNAKSNIALITSESADPSGENPPGPQTLGGKARGKPKLFGIFRKKKDSKKKQNSNTNNSNETISTGATASLSETHSNQSSGAKQLLSPGTILPRPTQKEINQSATMATPPHLFSNTLTFTHDLESVCSEIEGTLMRSFSQKIAEWALQPWSASKGTALAKVTESLREQLQKAQKTIPLLNPLSTQTEVFTSIDTNECYVLPSAHFPLLLSFDCERRGHLDESSIFGVERMYRAKVELLGLTGVSDLGKNESYTVKAAVAGTVLGSGRSSKADEFGSSHKWSNKNLLHFKNRSTWGGPATLELAIVEYTEGPQEAEGAPRPILEREIGLCWIDLKQIWEKIEASPRPSTPVTSIHKINFKPVNSIVFDEHGDVLEDTEESAETLELELKLTTIREENSGYPTSIHSMRRSLLYKHDDDLRQEMFAVQFIEACNRVLCSCGLDLKLLMYKVLSVGERRGFIEWVPGSVPLSEICQPFAGSLLGERTGSITTVQSVDAFSSLAKAGIPKHQSVRKDRSDLLAANPAASGSRNPIQDYFRSVAHDPNAPYMIRKEVMDTYIKSCAGYSVITYLLGVGDRHLDNLLLHPTGYFFHCDFSFILGKDPKKYLPMRITEDMILGMGGKDSDNYSMFLSLACATFLTLRRPENTRLLLSLIRPLESASIPNISVDQTMEASLDGVRNRLCLELNQEQAIEYMEKLIEQSQSSRMWLAVDAMHSLGKRF